MHSDVTTTRTLELRKAHTASRIARPEFIAFVGKIGCRISIREVERLRQHLPSYQACSIAGDDWERKNTQAAYDALDRFHDSIAALEITQSSCEVLKSSNDGLGGVAILELLGEWVCGYCYARLDFIVLKGRLEECLETRGL